MAELLEVPEAVVVRPGDMLVVRTSVSLARKDVAAIERQLQERLPGVDALVVCAEQMLVFRPGGGDG